MIIQELIPLGPKTTMRIGGKALYYAEILTEKDAEEAYRFSREKNVPLIVLGGGSNTIFADEVINALVVRIKASLVTLPAPPGATRDDSGALVTVEAGAILGSLLNELAAQNLDFSALTGIPGTLGGAIFGNAGQGAKGIWIDSFVESVTVLIDGKWKTLTREECEFRYRESKFKDLAKDHSVIIWSATLKIPTRSEPEVKAEIERLINKRIETQPHIKTAGSCFKSLPDGTPAWQLIEKAGLRGTKIGGIQISEKHANFLLNVEKGTFEDALAMTNLIQKQVPQISGIEMRLFASDGRIAA
ncbi:MAG: UDP-N-acetylmuramate dehydrogenase [Candidatus Peribacteraceae bacterium]|nr:UDP-N-acetylmuramate dehydrogenase [Candidatus Peribacteraceae bacterium]